jgi:hypothetical protein
MGFLIFKQWLLVGTEIRWAHLKFLLVHKISPSFFGAHKNVYYLIIEFLIFLIIVFSIDNIAITLSRSYDVEFLKNVFTRFQVEKHLFTFCRIHRGGSDNNVARFINF